MTSFAFDNSYARLPEEFFARVQPAAVPDPSLIRLNTDLATQLGLDAAWLSSSEGVTMFAGNKLPSNTDPISMVYAGHQFGAWVPQLGDGRAILLGELIDQHGIRQDIQLKGAGRTPFSRRGDGKAAMGPVLREYIVSEAMAAMGVPTTRALYAIASGEQIHRETLLPGAILVRVAQSHIRVGTFQYFHARNNTKALKTLADYVIDRHYPLARDDKNPYLTLLESIVQRQASLIAQWMNLGFIHGVMNTDNMQIAGETIDYGPCAFMDGFHPDTVFSFIDQNGRYAWSKQPAIALWNLMRLAETLLTVIDDDQKIAARKAEEITAKFSTFFNTFFMDGFFKKVGLTSGKDKHPELMENTFALMADHNIDFTLFFRQLTRIANGGNQTDFLALFDKQSFGKEWLSKWKECIENDPLSDMDRVALMRQVNPIFIPRNHRVEEVIESSTQGDFEPFHHLVDILSRPYDEQPDQSDFELPPRAEEVVQHTYCGT